jgi:enoyl-CoA hydratase/carnithine racemase
MFIRSRTGTPMSQSANVLVSRNDRVVTIELTRREKKNALTPDMYAVISDALVAADADDTVHVVLLHGQSDLFTAGNDVADFLDPAAQARGEGQRFIRTIASAKTPIVAAVGGIAIGVGVTMLMHCDLVVAAEEARFQLPFVSLGLCPEAGSSLLLPQLGGHRVAAELMLLGEMFGAAKAREAGIVTELVPAAALLERARTLAARLAGQPRDALFTTKALLRGPQDRTVGAAIEEELHHFARLLRSDAARSIFTAFLSRTPGT